MKQARFTAIPQMDYAANEAFNTLCTNISFSGEDKRCIEITSCREHDGKTTVCVQAWKKLAEMGFTVVLVDADLRRSIMDNAYGIRYSGTKEGLAHYMSRSDLEIEDILYETDIPNAYFIPSGHDVANSMQMLSGKKLGTLFEKLRETADYIIVDTSPIGAVIDAATVARRCDGILLLATQNVVTKQEILRAKEQLEKTECPILGVIMNKVDMSRSSSKYYSYGYYNSYYSDYYSGSKSGKRNPDD